MVGDIKNLRIHFYGVQGSSPVYPVKAERDEMRQRSDLSLLEQVFTKITDYVGEDNRLDCTVADILGGELSSETLKNFRAKLDLKEQKSYGGWTTCIRIETADGYDIVLDCGSGFRNCAQDIINKWGDSSKRNLIIFGSHAHFDHTEGFDQAEVCFDARNHIHVLANRSYLKALDKSLGIFSKKLDDDQEARQTPLNYKLMPASFESTEVRDPSIDSIVVNNVSMVDHYHDITQPIMIGKTKIQAFEVFHPDPCLAYRVEHNGKVFVYCTDHELRQGLNPEHPLQVASLAAEERLIEQSMNADVLYRDGQFLRAEYDGIKGMGIQAASSRRDWGHSCIEDVVAMAKNCHVKETYIGHHDPCRSWVELNSIDQMLYQKSSELGIKVELAKAETVIEL